MNLKQDTMQSVSILKTVLSGTFTVNGLTAKYRNIYGIVFIEYRQKL